METQPKGRPNPDQQRQEALQAFSLARVRRFAKLSTDPEELLSPNWRMLARHATLSAYRDCGSLGVGEEALQILRSVLLQASHQTPPNSD